MKFCSHCGNEVMDMAVICPKCGCVLSDIEIETKTTNSKKSKNISSTRYTAKVFAIIGTIFSAFLYLIPLCWTIPMTVCLSDKIKNGEEISVGFKICVLLFLNTISGILLLCDQN